MISINMASAQEVQEMIAQKLRARRLDLNLSQQSLSDKSGVSYGSLKKFENTGQISLESLIKLAIILDSIDDFNSLFAPKSYEKLSLDALISEKSRQRGRT
jgi:transcriptional regulator with XRE-family HTH domain